MDPTLTLLKEEINQTLDTEHDLAKWKLAATAVLGAAAFGLSKDGRAQYWLLLFIPFVCAYIDLFDYQYELRVRVIARFIRLHGDKKDLLQEYETECEQARQQRVFSLGNWSVFGCSLGACILGPVFYFLHRHYHPGEGELLVSVTAAMAFWLVGVLVIVALWLLFQKEARKLSGETRKPQLAKTA